MSEIRDHRNLEAWQRGYGCGPRDLQRVGGLSQVGDLRTGRSDATGGGVGAVERRGGVCPRRSRRDQPVEHCARIDRGTGHATRGRAEAGIRLTGSSGAPARTDRLDEASRQRTSPRQTPQVGSLSRRSSRSVAAEFATARVMGMGSERTRRSTNPDPIPDPRSPIPDPRSPIPDPRSPIPHSLQPRQRGACGVGLRVLDSLAHRSAWPNARCACSRSPSASNASPQACAASASPQAYCTRARWPGRVPHARRRAPGPASGQARSIADSVTSSSICRNR